MMFLGAHFLFYGSDLTMNKIFVSIKFIIISDETILFIIFIIIIGILRNFIRVRTLLGKLRNQLTMRLENLRWWLSWLWQRLFNMFCWYLNLRFFVLSFRIVNNSDLGTVVHRFRIPNFSDSRFIFKRFPLDMTGSILSLSLTCTLFCFFYSPQLFLKHFKLLQ